MVLLVEDHSSFRQALAMVIDREPEFSVVAQAGSLAEARRILSAVERIDLAVIDLSLPDGDGIEAVRALHDAHPRAMALILTASIDPTDHARAVEAGAAGVLHKAVSITAIVGALHRLGAGEWLLSQREVVELLRVATHRREQTREAQATLAQLTSRGRARGGPGGSRRACPARGSRRSCSSRWRPSAPTWSTCCPSWACTRGWRPSSSRCGTTPSISGSAW